MADTPCLCLRTCPIPPLPSHWARVYLLTQISHRRSHYTVLSDTSCALRTSTVSVVLGGDKSRKAEGGPGFGALSYFIITVVTDSCVCYRGWTAAEHRRVCGSICGKHMDGQSQVSALICCRHRHAQTLGHLGLIRSGVYNARDARVCLTPRDRA